MPGRQVEKLIPQVWIEGGVLALVPSPSVPPPAVGMAPVEHVHDVTGIAVDRDLGLSPFQGSQADDGPKDLHAVVGGLAESAREFLPPPIADQDDAIPAGPGIRAGGSVGVDGDLLGDDWHDAV